MLKAATSGENYFPKPASATMAEERCKNGCHSLPHLRLWKFRRQFLKTIQHLFLHIATRQFARCSSWHWFGCLLKEEREKRALSLNVLAQKAGLSRQTVSYVEQEVQNPTLETLLRITSVLEVDLEKIIAKARKTAAKRKE
jgi:DNA-binding XRE family transcriptional regulator